METENNNCENRYILSCDELADICGMQVDEIKNSLIPDELISLSGLKKGMSSGTVKKFLLKKGVSYSPVILSHINMRGGIGKTQLLFRLQPGQKSMVLKPALLIWILKRHRHLHSG